MSFKKRLVAAMRRSDTLTCLGYVVDNLLATWGVLRADRGAPEHLSGADLDRDLAYVRRTARHYLTHGGPVRGRIAEIGPGGNAGTALQLMAEGAESADLLDRFAYRHDPARLEAMYDAQIRSDPALAERFGEGRDLPIRWVVGEEAAAENFFRANSGYDAIVSCAVLEHLTDPVAALADMAAALNPGGALYHQVDLRDHGMFAGRHELTFLEVPGWIYPHMTRRRGRPNRVPLSRYREAAAAAGLKFEILVTNLVGVGEVEPARFEDLPAAQREAALADVRGRRARFAAEFKGETDTDLAVSGFFLRAWKPAAQAVAA